MTRPVVIQRSLLLFETFSSDTAENCSVCKVRSATTVLPSPGRQESLFLQHQPNCFNSEDLCSVYLQTKGTIFFFFQRKFEDRLYESLVTLCKINLLVESKAQNKASQFELWDKGTCDIHFCYLLLSFSELCPCGCDGLTMFLCVMFCIAERYVTSYFRCSVLYIIHISSEVNIKFCVKHRFGA